MINIVFSMTILGVANLMIGAANANAVVTTPGGGILTATDPIYNTYQNLALGFSIKYPNNLTVSENTSARIHHIEFEARPGSHLVGMSVITGPATGPFSLPITLDDFVRQQLMGQANVTVISKTKGVLNDLPDYRIEIQSQSYDVTRHAIVLETTVMYVTFNGGTGYIVKFGTFDKNQQTNFIPITNEILNSFQYK